MNSLLNVATEIRNHFHLPFHQYMKYNINRKRKLHKILNLLLFCYVSWYLSNNMFSTIYLYDTMLYQYFYVKFIKYFQKKFHHFFWYDSSSICNYIIILNLFNILCHILVEQNIQEYNYFMLTLCSVCINFLLLIRFYEES